MDPNSEVTQADTSLETFSVKEADRIYVDLAGVEGLLEYLKSTIQQDLLRYLNAPDDQKEMVKGALFRTRYMAARIEKALKTK